MCTYSFHSSKNLQFVRLLQDHLPPLQFCEKTCKMVQEYPGYKCDLVIGTIASHKCNSQVTQDGRFVFVGGLEAVLMWDLRKDLIVKRFEDVSIQTQQLYEATYLQLNREESEIAVGYSNGSVRVFSVASAEMKVHFSGHDSAVTVLRYSHSGIRLVSGSKDNDLVVWDISNECGECRLKGHIDVVNDCCFLDEEGLFLASCSKDSFIKIWDISIQHCVETIAGQKNELVSLSLSPSHSRIAVLTSEREVRMYQFFPEVLGKQLENDQLKCMQPHFSFSRQGKERPERVAFHPTEPFCFVQNTTDRTVEIYKVRSEDELKKKANRRKQKENSDSPLFIASDEITFIKAVKFSHKLKFVEFLPVERGKSFISVLAVLTNNSYEVMKFNPYETSIENDKSIKINELCGHHSAIKQVCIAHGQELFCTISNDMIKLWNVRTGNLVRSIECKQVSCVEFLPHDRELLVGTKTGELEIYDIASGALVESVKAHSGNISCLAIRNDHRSFCSGSSDKEVKCWDFELVPVENDCPSSVGCNGKRMSFVLSDTLSLTDEITCLRYSPDSKYIAIGLLDFTIKVFFVDSLKFYLSLYGHKLPCFSIDISADSKRLISASHDKNIKIWGLDFGDCHKSIFAHQDAVTCVRFVGNGNLFVSTSKDRFVKMWDARNFQQVSKYRGHHDEVWGIAGTQDGEYLLSISNDRTIRRWIKTDEPLFLEEEREKELEEAHDQQLKMNGMNQTDAPEKVTIDSLKNCDKVIETVEQCEEYLESWRVYNEQKERGLPCDEPPLNPIFCDRYGEPISPSHYLLSVFERIPTAELRSVLLVLPFNIVLGTLKQVEIWFKNSLNLSLCCSILNTLLEIHLKTLSTSSTARPLLEQIRALARQNITKAQDIFHFNNAALCQLRKSWELEFSVKFFDEERINELKLRSTKKIQKRHFIKN